MQRNSHSHSGKIAEGLFLPLRAVFLAAKPAICASMNKYDTIRMISLLVL